MRQNNCHFSTNERTTAAQNLSLEDQIKEANLKIELLEQMMISQSRMAIMGEMIGMIAHQWRQPITIIGMITNNAIIDLQINEWEKDKLIQDLQSVDKQVHYLSHTIDDFRNFFRPNKLPQQITFQEISSEIITILGKNFETNQIQLIFSGDFSIPITTYKNELLQVFLNILNNAKDAFLEKKITSPVIHIRAQMVENKINFEIQDNAGGIHSEHIRHIFEPYFSTKDEQHGTGLGLYMSAIIIQKHIGGSIEAFSKGDETVFKISIPIKLTQDNLHVY